MKTVPVTVAHREALEILGTPAMTLVPHFDGALNVHEFRVWIGGEETAHVLRLSQSGQWSMQSALPV